MNTYSQFHQHLTSSFCGNFILPVSTEKLRKTLSCKKSAHKMLVKLTPKRYKYTV